MIALLGGPTNPAQIFPEPELLIRMESGQLDAAVFYRHEVVAHGLPFIELPDEVNQSNYLDQYHRAAVFILQLWPKVS